MLCIRIRTLLQQYNDLRNAVRTSYRYGIYCCNNPIPNVSALLRLLLTLVMVLCIGAALYLLLLLLVLLLLLCIADLLLKSYYFACAILCLMIL